MAGCGVILIWRDGCSLCMFGGQVLLDGYLPLCVYIVICFLSSVSVFARRLQRLACMSASLLQHLNSRGSVNLSLLLQLSGYCHAAQLKLHCIFPPCYPGAAHC